jgi:hypothetical protein
MQAQEVLNPINTSALRVGVVHWHIDHKGDGFTSLLSNTLKELGCETVDFLHNARLPKDLDAVLVDGPLDSLVPLANQLLAYPPSRRPIFVLLMTEQFPNPKLPEWMRYLGGIVRSRAGRLAFRQQHNGTWQIDPRLRWLTTKAHRLLYYGDLFWLKRQGILSILAVTSYWTADFLRARGFDPIVAYVGPHPSWGADLGLERDISVLWLGKIATHRRRRLLLRIQAELKERGVEMMVIDGVKHPYIFGEERTVLLNRTKIALNLLRAEWDDNTMRYCLAAPNRAMIVSEPTLPHTAFKPGVHLVEAPIDQLTNTICYYLSHEEKRQQIVNQAYQLATTELNMSNGAAQLLDHIVAMRENAQEVKS